MRIITYIIAAIFSLQGLAQAQEPVKRLEKRPLDISVAPKIWNAGENDVKAVVSSAANEIWRNLKYGQMSSIYLSKRDGSPMCIYQHDNQNRLQIQLVTGGQYWCQYMYQFAHEFCHGMCGHAMPYQEQWKQASSENHWLEESLCEMASWFALRSAAKTWATNAPYPNWLSYSKAIQDYVDKDMAPHSLPQGKTFTQWLNEHQGEMRTNSCIRDLNAVVARQLLPLFEAEPKAWEVMLYRNRAKSEKGDTLQQHLQRWHDQCPVDLKPFMKKLMAALNVTSGKAAAPENKPAKDPPRPGAKTSPKP